MAKTSRKKKDEDDLLGPAPVLSKNEWGLNERQEAFAQHYTREANGTLAAKLAGYSHATAAQIASEYLRHPNIQARIKILREAANKGYDGLREKIINKLMVMAELDPAQLYEDDGHTLKPIHEWDLSARQSLSGFETRVGTLGVNKVKLVDRTKALEMLIKMQGYYAPEKVMPVDGDGNYTPPNINVHVVPPQKENG